MSRGAVAIDHNIGGLWRQLGDAAIGMVAGRQHGVVAYWQLVTFGAPRRAIEHRLATGRLHRIYTGVYAVGHRNLSPNGHRMAAVLAFGPHAVLSHRSAAALWGLRRSAQIRNDVTIPGSGRRTRPKIRIHRSTCLHPDDMTRVDGIPVTAVPRTLMDVAAILDRDRLMRVVEQAVRLDLFDLIAVEAAIARTPGRAGVKRLRRVLAAYREPADTRSGFERRFLKFVERAGLPRPQTNVVLAGYVVDVYWPQWKLIVELDSVGYHMTPSAFETDRLRDAATQRIGCRTLRLTEQRLKYEPARVLDDILALARLASSTATPPLALPPAAHPQP